MKHVTISTLFITACICGAVSADARFIDSATITSIEPIYRQHTIEKPYQDCHIKTVYEPGTRIEGDGSSTNELLGGIVGGAIGNQFGAGSGKDAMTVAGALLGASIANDREKKNTPGRYVDKRICETKYDYITENRLSHYKVNYKYQGQKYSYKANTKPRGSTVKVRVNINPL